MNPNMKCSIVLTTFDKPNALIVVLNKLFQQRISFSHEVIVINDGPSEKTIDICEEFCISHSNFQYYSTGNTEYRNPSVARNTGYKLACGDYLISMCDDVVPITDDVVERLVQEVGPIEFLLARVLNYKYSHGKPKHFVGDYCTEKRRAEFFFMGVIARKHMFAVGGNDEEFVEPSWEDNWLKDCLTKGLALIPRISDAITAHHMDHGRFPGSHRHEKKSHSLYLNKIREANRSGVWQASGGPWNYVDQKSFYYGERELV